MTGDAEEIHPHVLHIDGKNAGTLGTVQRYRNFIFPGHGGNPLHREPCAPYIGGMGADNQPGFSI